MKTWETNVKWYQFLSLPESTISYESCITAQCLSTSNLRFPSTCQHLEPTVKWEKDRRLKHASNILYPRTLNWKRWLLLNFEYGHSTSLYIRFPRCIYYCKSKEPLLFNGVVRMSRWKGTLVRRNIDPFIRLNFNRCRIMVWTRTAHIPERNL